MKFQKLIFTATMAAVLTACGGGGSDDTKAPVVMSQGIFVDAPVKGLQYKSPSASGVTDAMGKFDYVPGETVTFSVGGTVIGSAVGGAVITPVQLVPGATDVTNDTVTNIASFLQSLDSGGTPDSLISISDSSRAALGSSKLNFAQTPAAFAADPAVKNAMAAASPGKPLVSAQAAQNHMTNQMNCLYAGVWEIIGSNRSNQKFTATISEVDGSIKGTTAADPKSFMTGSIHAYTGSINISAYIAQAYPAGQFNVDVGNGRFSARDSVSGTWGSSLVASWDQTSNYSGTWTGKRISTPTACGGTGSTPPPGGTGTSGALAYTVYGPDLSSSTQIATIATNGAAVTTSLPLNSKLIATFTTSDGGANYTWGGASIGGGGERADGNIALACTGTTMQSGYAAVSANMSKVTDLTKAYGKTFTEKSCGSADTTFTFAADGSSSNNVGDRFTAAQTSQIFTSAGLTGPGGSNYRGTAYSYSLGAVTQYFYVIQADETPVNGVKHVSVGFQQ